MADRKYQTKIRSSGFQGYLVTQFLGAFNDNVFKIMIICHAIRSLPEKQVNVYVPLAGGVFILPFLLFSAYAGYLADRFSKKTVMVWAKAAEVLVMLLGVVFFHCRAVWTLCFVLFCMGTQSAFFSPAKYGFLPEVLSEEDLSCGNGLTQLFTFLPIVLGGWAGGAIMAGYGDDPGRGAMFCLAIAVFGLLAGFGIQPTPPGHPRTRFTMDPFTPHWRAFQKMRKDRMLLLGLLGCSFFWMIGVFFQLSLPLLFTKTLRMGDDVVGYAQAVLALGIGAGCSLAGALSRRRIEYGLVLPGVFLTACSSLAIGILSFHWLPAFVFIASAGLFGGFLQLPLGATIQKRSPKDNLGSCLGAANALDCVAMILGTVLQGICLNLLRLSPAGSFVFGGLVALAATAVIMGAAPALAHRTKKLLRP